MEFKIADTCIRQKHHNQVLNIQGSKSFKNSSIVRYQPYSTCFSLYKALQNWQRYSELSFNK